MILVTSFSQSSYITFMELHHYTIYLLIKKLLFMDLLKGCHYREPLDSDGSKKNTLEAWAGYSMSRSQPSLELVVAAFCIKIAETTFGLKHFGHVCFDTMLVHQ